jgi:hypothetical protein
MYTLIRLLPLRQLLQEQLPALAFSFVVAEMLYKFHSFTLECLAFLLTWYVVDATVQFGRKALRSDQGGTDAISH